MDMSSPEMQAIAHAAAMFQGGQRDEGRARLLELWETLESGGEPMQVSALAHVLADTETDPAAALEWDLRALEAVVGSREAGDREPVSPAMADFLPSLHLSVCENYRRLSDLGRARRHLDIAARHVGRLPDDDYGRLIRHGLKTLQARVVEDEAKA